jgi:hypothetical protein
MMSDYYQNRINEIQTQINNYFEKELDEENERIKRMFEYYNTKECSKCKEKKTFDNFRKTKRNKSGLYPQCRKCESKYKEMQSKKDNLDCTLFCNTIVSSKNKKVFYKILRYKYGNEYVDRIIFDDLKSNLRNRCLNAFKKIKINKPCKTIDLLGADFNSVKLHLESKFKDGMSWDNMGFYGWHIDHIKPLALAQNKDELLKLLHYTNLQPLWAYDNLSKNSKYNGVSITYKNRHLFNIHED